MKISNIEVIMDVYVRFTVRKWFSVRGGGIGNNDGNIITKIKNSDRQAQ